MSALQAEATGAASECLAMEAVNSALQVLSLARPCELTLM